MSFRQYGELFEQLGLARDAPAVAAFIRGHAPLHGNIRIEDAVFWSPTQAALLREKIQDDADWCGVVDQLNLALRAIRP